MKLDNPHLPDLSVDHFHHLGFASDSTNLLNSFQDVKFVCMSGSTGRAKKFSLYLNAGLGLNKEDDEVLQNLCLTDRYVMYKVGPVIVANHGMGVPSLRIIMNEILKVLHYANAKDVTFFRIGTSGGIGLEPGTLVLTRQAVNGCFEAKITEFVLGEVRETSTVSRSTNIDKIMEVGESVCQNKQYDFVLGDTMCCDDFYEGQGRLDGAFCNFSKEDRSKFLKTAHDRGVRNIEMECTMFLALCNKANVDGFVVCVTLLNRLLGDQITVGAEQLHEFETRPFDLVLAYIKACTTKTS